MEEGDGLLKSSCRFLEFTKQRGGCLRDDNERDFSTVRLEGVHLISSWALTFKVCYFHVFKNTLSSSGFRLVRGTQRTDTGFLQTSFPPSPPGNHTEGGVSKQKLSQQQNPFQTYHSQRQEFVWMLYQGVGRVLPQPVQS